MASQLVWCISSLLKPQDSHNLWRHASHQTSGVETFYVFFPLLPTFLKQVPIYFSTKLLQVNAETLFCCEAPEVCFELRDIA